MTRIVLVALILLSPVVAGAEATLSPNVTAGLEYDPNVLRTQSNAKGDVLFRVTPTLKLDDKYERWSYHLRYGVPLERGIWTSTDLGFDHTPSAAVNFRISERTKLRVSDRLRYAEIRNKDRDLFEDEDTGDFLTITDTRMETVLQNSFDASLSHRLGAQLTGSFGVSYDFFDTTDPDRSDNQSFGSRTNLSYNINGDHTVNGGVSASRQVFDDRTALQGSTTDFYSVNLGWSWRIDETTTLSVRVSPTFVTSEQNRPDPVSMSALYPVSITGPNTFNRDNPVTGARETGVFAPAGSIIYNRLATCPLLPGSTTPVLSGAGTCGQTVLLNDPGNASGLNGGVTTLAQEVAAINAITANQSTVTSSFVDIPQSNTTDTLTLFGGVTLSKRWTRQLQSSFNYTRRESTASGVGGSTVMDSVSLTNRWRISPLWSLSMRTDYTLRTSLSDQTVTYAAVEGDPIAALAAVDLARRISGPGGLVFAETGSAVDTQRWTIGGSLKRQITPSLVGTLSARYNQQSSKQPSLGASSDFTNYIVGLRFTYNFDPIDLW